MAIDLASIRTLYRQPDCLALWGIPYNMRPGQSPRDLWNAPRPDVLARVAGRSGAMMHAPGPLDDWIFLGCPGWWCNIPREDQQQIQIWLDKLGDLVPGNPCEWATVPRLDTATEMV